jgi:lipoprotein-anchoring transpeptidase ErfK/SrfK
MRAYHLFAAIAAAVMACLSVGPASAQSLGLWGGWDEGGHSWQGSAPGARPQQPTYSMFDPFETPAFPAIMDGGGQPHISPRIPHVVAFPNTEAPRTIVIDTAARRLYLTLNNEEAFEYMISVGREGFTWTGTEKISRIADWPEWHPPVEMRARDPKLPEKMTGGIRNPLGAVAMFLGNSLYRIHGTNDPKTIGIAASSGCFRMMNEDAVHLASLVQVGTIVKVLPHLPETQEAARPTWPASARGLGTIERDGG